MDRHREELRTMDIDVLETSIGSIITFQARRDIVRHGDRVEPSMLLVDGLVCRYVDKLDGSHRLIALHVPGNFVGLHG